MISRAGNLLKRSLWSTRLGHDNIVPLPNKLSLGCGRGTALPYPII